MTEKLYHRCGVCVQIKRGQIELSRDDQRSIWFTLTEWLSFINEVKCGDFEPKYLNKFIHKKEYLEPPHGVIEKSIKFLEINKKKIGEIVSVEGKKEGTDYWTIFKDAEGNKIVTSGFSWGYYGEGPSGLYITLTNLGFTVTPDEIANYNKDDDFETMLGINLHIK